MQHLGGELVAGGVGQRSVKLNRHALHGLLQVRVTLGALSAVVLGLRAQIVQAIQLANGVHPGKRPAHQVRMGVGQLEVVAPLMGPAKCKQDPGIQTRKLLVGLVPVAADDAACQAVQ